LIEADEHELATVRAVLVRHGLLAEDTPAAPKARDTTASSVQATRT
jgi:hypothetical protein